MQLKNRKGGRRKYHVKKRREHILSEKVGKWIAMDFIIDTVIDPVSKVAPRIVPAYSMGGQDVAGVLEEMWRRQRFIILQTDNEPEFRSKDVRDWCERHGVRQVFSRPGNPTDNCFIESFNRIFREECLNANYFSSLAVAKQIIGALVPLVDRIFIIRSLFYFNTMPQRKITETVHRKDVHIIKMKQRVIQ